MTFRHRIFALGVAALLFSAAPAYSAAIVVCSPEQSSGAQARTVNNPNTGNTYSLNGQGCAVMRSDDAAYFVGAQGFSQGQNTFDLFFSQQTTGFNFVLPLSSYIRSMIFSELTGNSVASGICVGTTNGGSDVATMVGTGSTLKAVSDVSLAKRVFSISASQQIFVGSCLATGLGTSKYDVTVEYGYF